MENNPEDQQVIDLLSKLKNSSGAYPSDILATRRQNYLKQVANVGLGIGVGAGLKNAAKSGNGAGTAATVTSKILETALIAAIAIEAGTVAYLYRDKIADAIRTYTGSSNIQEIVPPSNSTSSPSSELAEITEFPTIIVTPSGTVTITTSATSLPEVAGDNNNNDTNISANATPNPGGNNGNQYGLTPKPVRTKDNNDTDGGGNNDNGGGSGGGNGGNGGGGKGNNNKP